MNKDKNYSKSDEEIDLLLQRISNSLEVDSGIFGCELFPSYRSNTIWAYKRPDSNIFSSLSVLFVLRGINKFLPIGLYEKLAQKICYALPKYQNMHGGISYNFWETKPSNHFPHGKVLHKFKHFKLPDDIDDTALAFLLKDSSQKEVAILRDKITAHSLPLEKEKAFAYNTWFGEKMPFEKDVCALSNLMFLFQKSGLEPNEYDENTFQYLSEVIKEGDYLVKPFLYARHYGSVALIIYHLARFMESFHVPSLENHRELLIQQAKACFENAPKEMEKVLLQSSLQKLGIATDFNFNFKKIENEPFYPFIGAPFAPFENRFLRKLASQKWAIINWECDALKWAYCLENSYLKQQEKS